MVNHLSNSTALLHPVCTIWRTGQHFCTMYAPFGQQYNASAPCMHHLANSTGLLHHVCSIWPTVQHFCTMYAAFCQRYIISASCLHRDCCGTTRVQTWYRHGTDMVQKWYRHGTEMVQTWYMRWYRAGNALVTSWPAGRRSWEHSGNVLGTFRNVLGTFPECSPVSYTHLTLPTKDSG